jgi:threonine synthase
METKPSYLDFLECPECGKHFNAEQIQTICGGCKSPLIARYDLNKIREELKPPQLLEGRGVWRWAPLLPVRSAAYRFSLGEGDTPLVNVSRIAGDLGCENIYVKDESPNPTGSFKARGLGVAVSRAVELGIRSFVIPTAGNAGGALAAYAARAHCHADVYMPADAPESNKQEVKTLGAKLHLVNGLINDAARLAAEEGKKNGWFDVSTFKEPYRVEGKKTMGLELAEAFNWSLPDVIIYPTGGGTGLVGMWKAFEELEELGWIGSFRPRMVVVQAEGCAPVVKAYTEDKERAELWPDAYTGAAGLRVPYPFADRMILRAVRQSNGTALAVSDNEMRIAQSELAAKEGIFAAPEGAATLAALKKLVSNGWVRSAERVVLFNTGSGLKYLGWGE